VWAAETTARSQPYYTIPAPPKLAIIFGSEQFGVAPDTLDAADRIVEIPQYGCKNSLNIAVAASIMVFDVRRQHAQTA
jgi:tRNA G18 (ribose-2'-O)-methylase SpoU